MRFDWLDTYAPLLLLGLRNTIILTALAGALGFALALVVALGCMSRRAWIRWPLRLYISVVRGTPLLVQIYVLYYGVGTVLADQPWLRESWAWPLLREGYCYVALALVLSEGAYLGEILRTALLAVPRGELEAGRAYGMSELTLARRIWLPRALGSVLPALAGESVMLLKSTSLASMVALVDLLGAARLVRQRTYLDYEPLLVAAAGYLVLTLAIEGTFRALERRAGRPFRRPTGYAR